MTATSTTSAIVILKNSSYVVAFITGVEWFGFNPEAIAIFTALMMLDIVTGVLRTFAIEGGYAIKSATLKRGVVAKLLILTALFSVALAGRGVGFEMQNLVQGAVSVFILGELYSILGNVHSARTGDVKVEFDAVAWLISKVKEILVKVLKI